MPSLAHSDDRDTPADPRWWSARWSVIAAVLVGVLVRLIYLVATPFNVRNYDVMAHVDYILYMQHHWWVPQASMGWEMHQAPLYYFVAALWTIVQPGRDMLHELQGFALVCSLATLLIGAWIAVEVFPRRRQAWLAGLFTLGIAVFPSLVFLTSRVNNDVLYAPLTLGGFGLLLWWWRAPKRRRWTALCLLLTAALLTKTSGLLLIGAAGLCLVFHPRLTLQECLKQALIMLVVLSVGAGWYHALRHEQRFGLKYFTESSETTSGLSRALFVGNKPSDYVTLPLIKTIQEPYVNTWNDKTYRSNFWAFAYRSAYFGEFYLGEPLKGLARGILISGYGVAVLALAGAGLMLRKREGALTPLLAVLAIQFAGLMGYRLLNPFACNQDFRFIVVASAPLLALAVLGIERLPMETRKPVLTIFVLHLALCAAFITALLVLGI